MKEGTGHIAKKILGGLVMLFLLLPLIHQYFPFYKPEPLGGWDPNASPAPTLTWKQWRSGKYQDSMQAYVGNQFPFRPDLVRFNNQVEFDLFRELNGRVEAGKDGYFFGKPFLDAYLGLDYLGMQAIEEQSRRLRLIQDSLEALGKQMYIVVAPSGADYYAEHIRPSTLARKQDSTNYEAYLRSFDKYDLNYLDFNRWFLSMKDTSTYPLYPSTGVHWSHYSQFFVVDSLVRLVEQLQGVELPQLVMDSVTVGGEFFYGDNDIGEAANLYYYTDPIPLAKPHFHWTERRRGKAKVLVIADSFYWGPFLQYKLPYQAFDNGEFWYYNKEVSSYNQERTGLVREADIYKRFLEHDVVFILGSSGNLNGFPWGFDNTAGQALVQVPEKEIQTLRATMVQDEQWMDMIRQKAEGNEISVEEQVRLDLKYMLFNQVVDGKSFQTDLPRVLVEAHRANILKTESWKNDIQKKAEEAGIAFEAALMMDSEYVARLSLKENAPENDPILRSYLQSVLEFDRDLMADFEAVELAGGPAKTVQLDSAIQAYAERLLYAKP